MYRRRGAAYSPAEADTIGFILSSEPPLASVTGSVSHGRVAPFLEKAGVNGKEEKSGKVSNRE